MPSLNFLALASVAAVLSTGNFASANPPRPPTPPATATSAATNAFNYAISEECTNVGKTCFEQFGKKVMEAPQQATICTLPTGPSDFGGKISPARQEYYDCMTQNPSCVGQFEMDRVKEIESFYCSDYAKNMKTYHENTGKTQQTALLNLLPADKRQDQKTLAAIEQLMETPNPPSKCVDNADIKSLPLLPSSNLVQAMCFCTRGDQSKLLIDSSKTPAQVKQYFESFGLTPQVYDFLRQEKKNYNEQVLCKTAKSIKDKYAVKTALPLKDPELPYLLGGAGLQSKRSDAGQLLRNSGLVGAVVIALGALLL